ncbi:MAG TPA: BON domain-containing protein [Acidobacteriota bacterium]|nr:BON domain-containing protein [Acidobacteriota bacterium]
MKKYIGLCIFVICLALTAFTGCSDNYSKAEPKDQQAGTEDKRSDTVITTELKAKITDDELLDNTDVSVDTENGVVTLTGTVHNADQEQRANELAKNTEGVVSVKSNLRIEPESSTGKALKEQSKETGENIKDATGNVAHDTKEAMSDARITSETKLKFAADDTVKALNIDVDTDNGVVTLRGTVNSKAELNKAIALAKSVKGVKKVISELEIVNQ